MLVHLAEEHGAVMPRLSVGLPAISQSGVVISTDLHVLVTPDRFFWYSRETGSQDPEGQLIRDFTALGLPWLRARASLDGLARDFEDRVRETQAEGKKTLWRRLVGAGPLRRPSPFDLKVLSHCYELLGRTAEALDSWRRYLALLVRPGEADRARLAQLETAMGRVSP
jgi:hypothetical protein